MQTHSGRSLCLARLEDRFTPVIYGLPWLNPDHLSSSFVQKRALIGGVGRNVFTAFNRPCYMIVRESAAPARSAR